MDWRRRDRSGTTARFIKRTGLAGRSNARARPPFRHDALQAVGADARSIGPDQRKALAPAGTWAELPGSVYHPPEWPGRDQISTRSANRSTRNAMTDSVTVDASSVSVKELSYGLKWLCVWRPKAMVASSPSSKIWRSPTSGWQQGKVTAAAGRFPVRKGRSGKRDRSAGSSDSRILTAWQDTGIWPQLQRARLPSGDARA